MKRSIFILLALAGLFVVAPILAGWALFWSDLTPEDKAVFVPLVEPRIPLIVATIIFGAIYCMIVVRPLYKRYVQLPQRMAEDIRLLLAQPGRRLEPYGAAELQVIANAVNELADHRQALETDVEEKVARGKEAVESERNRLAALMGELTQSVVVCNLDGRVLLYNNRARLQFRAMSSAPSAAGGGEIIGLGRSIHAVFERELIAHALETIQQGIRKGTEQPVANFVTTTKTGQLLRFQMAAVLSGGDGSGERVLTGYVLMLDNITVMFEKESKRDALLQSLTEGNRAALGSIRAACEMLIEVPDMSAEERERFLSVIRAESEQMGERLATASTQFVDALKSRWPLEEMRGADLIAAAARRISSALQLPVRQDVELVDQTVWIKVDSFSLIQALTYFASRLADEYAVRDVRFRLGAEGRLAHLDLCWQGAAMSTETVMNWELEAMSFAGESTPLTVREVVDRCDGEMWFQRERASHLAFFRFALPVAKPRKEIDESALLRVESRPDYYDFDLFKSSDRSHALDEKLLSELTFTIFDTETTGLNPREGDEIIQVGATRVLNGKLLKNEFFEQLIDPRRRLPASSTAIHGITPDMLKGQPPIGQVLPAFHAFAADTVLVAHNAAFDMRFLQIKEESTGIRFDHPVLDTLLLSAVIHPNQESHRLEAIAERLGITIVGRHTAMGDAIVTGEVFIRMLPLLADMGILTLRQALDAAQKTWFARVKY